MYYTHLCYVFQMTWLLSFDKTIIYVFLMENLYLDPVERFDFKCKVTHGLSLFS